MVSTPIAIAHRLNELLSGGTQTLRDNICKPPIQGEAQDRIALTLASQARGVESNRPCNLKRSSVHLPPRGRGHPGPAQNISRSEGFHDDWTSLRGKYLKTYFAAPKYVE